MWLARRCSYFPSDTAFNAFSPPCTPSTFHSRAVHTPTLPFLYLGGEGRVVRSLSLIVDAYWCSGRCYWCHHCALRGWSEVHECGIAQNETASHELSFHLPQS